MKSDIHELVGHVRDLRSEVGNLVPKLVAANIASMIGIAGLVIAAGALF